MSQEQDFERAWLAKLSTCLEEIGGAEIRNEVMKGSDGLSSHSSRQDVIEWSKGAMERLDALVDNEEVRRNIMLCCSHIFPQSRIRKLRAEYERLGRIDELLKIMHKDRSWRGTSCR